MKCPNGHEKNQKVYMTRQGDGVIYRRRMCLVCGVGYKTREEIFTGMIPRVVEHPKRTADEQRGENNNHLFNVWRT